MVTQVRYRPTLPSPRASPSATSSAHVGLALPSSRRAFASVVGLLTSAASLTPPLPAAARLPVCSFTTLESLPGLIGKVGVARLRGDLSAAKAALDEEPLLSNMALLSASLEACTPAVEGGSSSKDVQRALAELREEVNFQIAKGVSDPRLQDPDDVADLLRCTKKAQRTIERYLEGVPTEKRAKS